MRKVVAKIYSCNWETYKKIYVDAIVRAYAKDNIKVSSEEITVQLETLDGDSIQSQRHATGEHKRVITVYDNEKIRYIIGLSNTGYDEDKRIEAETKGGKYKYGNSDWHSNTYLCQGINKIFEYYYDKKLINPDVKLYFYLLDTETKSYPNNLSNTINYRKLATIGFEILNIDNINFECFEKIGFSLKEAHNNIKYVSFNKFANDILYTSKRHNYNVPSYLKCVDLEYDISQETDEEDTEIVQNTYNQKYIYTFKTLGAEAYDSFLTMWTLQVLAQQENKNLEFLFSSEKYDFRSGQTDVKMTTDFPTPITTLFEKIGLDIKYENSDEILQEFEREKSQYKIAKSKNILRNQELFKNNMRAKGIETKCYLCGCEVEEILEAAHLWGVAEIKKAPAEKIYNAINNTCLKKLIDDKNPNSKEEFYKRYVMANSGDNGIWLCSNHHGLYDGHYYIFSSEDGKVLFNGLASEEAKTFFNTITKEYQLKEDVLTSETKVFLQNNNEKYIKA